MADKITKRTNLVWNRKAFKKNMKKLTDAHIRGQREEMNKLTKILVTGFNDIVANWDDKPKFTSHVRYTKSTGRFFVRVQIGGSDEAQDHWNWVDKGAHRSTTINADGVAVPSKVQLKKLAKPGPARGGQKSDLIAMRLKYKKETLYQESPQDFGVWMRKEIFRQKQIQKASIQKASKEMQSRKGWMPMRTYTSKTSRQGDYGLKGGFAPAAKGDVGWRHIPYVTSVTPGDIDARRWTDGILLALAGKGDPFQVRRHFPRVRTFKSWVASGYRRGNKYAEAR
jgi:hypothetical protein